MAFDLQDWLPAGADDTLKSAKSKGRKLAAKAGRKGRRAAKDAQTWAEHRIDENRTWLPYAGVAVAGFAAGVAALGARKVAMQAMTSVAGDWFDTLKADHRLVEKLFELVTATEEHETGKRTVLLAKITYALVKHALEEENVVYPALREADAEAAAKHLAAEHFDIKTYLHDLAETPKDDPKWMATMHKLQALVLSHVREEEEDLYPVFHAKMSADQNAHLTAAMNREGIKVA